MVRLAFSVFGAAMFAEPAVTNVEEVVGLVHGCEVPGAGYRVSVKQRNLDWHPTPDTRPPFLLPAPSVRCLRQAHRDRHAAAVAQNLHLDLIANCVLV